MADYSKRLNTGKGIINFPSLIKVKENTNAKTGKTTRRFESMFIFKKDSPEAKALAKEFKAARMAAFPELLPEDLKIALKDGDAENAKRTRKKKKAMPELEGCVYIQPWTGEDSKPDLYDGQTRLTDDDVAKRLFYSGAHCAGLINIKSYDAGESQGVTCYLMGVQFFNHGERIGGGGGGPTDDLLAPEATGTSAHSAEKETEEPLEF